MRPITYPRTTPRANSAAPKRDPRSILAPHAERLTALMLAPSKGEHCADKYTDDLRRDVGKFRRNPVLMALVIAYNDVQKGKSADDVKRWLVESCELVDLWCEERDGLKIEPADLTPLLVKSQRRENAENEVELAIAANQDCPDTLERFIVASAAEIEADSERLDVARGRLARLKARGGASVSGPVSRSLAGAGR